MESTKDSGVGVKAGISQPERQKGLRCYGGAKFDWTLHENDGAAKTSHGESKDCITLSRKVFRAASEKRRRTKTKCWLSNRKMDSERNQKGRKILQKGDTSSLRLSHSELEINSE